MSFRNRFSNLLLVSFIFLSICASSLLDRYTLYDSIGATVCLVYGRVLSESSLVQIASVKYGGSLSLEHLDGLGKGAAEGSLGEGLSLSGLLGLLDEHGLAVLTGYVEYLRVGEARVLELVEGGEVSRLHAELDGSRSLRVSVLLAEEGVVAARQLPRQLIRNGDHGDDCLFLGRVVAAETPSK